MSSTTLEGRLRPYEHEIATIQEVLLFHRPLVLVIIIVGLLSTAHFISRIRGGFFATVAFIACVYYSIVVIAAFFGDFLKSILFSELPPWESRQSNRVRSIAEVAEFLVSLKAAIPSALRGWRKRIAVAMLFALAAIAVDHLRILLIAVAVLLLLPGILLLPSVYEFWYPWAQKTFTKEKQD
jgi:hypothetical protein